ERRALAQGTENDIQLGMTIEQTAGHQSQSVRCCFDTECPRRSPKPRMTFQNGFTAEERIARMQIERIVQLFQLGPERLVTWIVEIHDVAGIADLRESI